MNDKTQHMHTHIFMFRSGRPTLKCGMIRSPPVYIFKNQQNAFCFVYTGHFIMFCMITNIYNKKAKGPTLMELFTATGKRKKFFFDN
jgi:hypothetical protein